MASFYAVIAGYVSGMFETRVRYTAISLAYQICGAIAGGLTPLIGTWLAHTFSGQWWPMAVLRRGAGVRGQTEISYPETGAVIRLTLPVDMLRPTAEPPSDHH